MTSFNPEFDLAHGEGVNVQQIRSRGVTRIEIEVRAPVKRKAASTGKPRPQATGKPPEPAKGKPRKASSS